MERPYFQSGANNEPQLGDKVACIEMVTLLLNHDPHATAVFLQPQQHDPIPLTHQLALKIAKSSKLHKSVVSPEFKSSTPIQHYITTLMWLSNHQPLHQPLVELGMFGILFQLLASTPKSTQLNHAICNFLETSFSLLTAQNIHFLLKFYFSAESTDFLHMLTNQPTINLLIAEQLLLLVQSKVNPIVISKILVPSVTEAMMQLGTLETLHVLPNPSTATLETLRCLQFKSWTSQQIRLLVRYLVMGSDFKIVVNILETIQGDELIMEELNTQFSIAILSEDHIKSLQLVLQYNRTKELMTKTGLLNSLMCDLTYTTLASSIPEFMDVLVNDTNKAILLLQHLIMTNNLQQLAFVVNEFNMRKVLSTVLTSEVCATVVKAGVPTPNLPRELQDAMLAYFRVPPISRDKQAPWYIDASLLSSASGERKYVYIPGQPKDLELVTKLYQRSSVPGYDIKSVTILHSEHLFNSFVARVEALQGRSGKEVFAPHWPNNNRLSKEEITHRQKVLDLFYSLAVHKYSMAPDVSFVLSWHGTHQSIISSLLSTGFANLATTDAGFFGKGLYTTPDAEYAFRVYSSGALLLNWVAAFSPFPVIAQDEPELAEKGNFRNYDAHFVPVFSPNHPDTIVYHACKSNEEPQYSELVVFESAQMLAHYIIELQPTMPREVLQQGTKAVTLTTKKFGLLANWSVADVCKWFSSLPLTQDYSTLLQENGINGEVLMTMTQQDWKDLGMKHFGDSRIVATRVSRLQM